MANTLRISLLYLLVALAGCQPESSEKSNSPNVIFIMADDLGYADLGSYGQKVIKTPHIDALANRGVRFTQCYSGSPVCAPSRSTLMTGQHTGHTTVRGNSSPLNKSDPQGRVPLEDEDYTMAEAFKAAGYVTGMTGKWGLGEPGTLGIPTRQGFDQWFGYLNQRRAHHYYTEYLWKNEGKVYLTGNENGGKQEYSHDLFTEFAIDFIESNADTSFFLYLPYTIPHDEYEIPSTDPYNDSSWTEDERVYAAMVHRLDKDVGRIDQKLRDLGIEENTLIVFCSDNGAASRWEGRFNSSGELKGKKRDMYEGGIRVPLIMTWPGKLPAGTTNKQVIYFPDFLPTFSELIDVEVPGNVDGRNLWDQISNVGEPVDRVLYWEFTEYGFQQAARWKDWKAVRLAKGADLEIYDLKNDAGEEHNVADQFPGVVDQMEQLLDTIRTESKYWPSNLGDSTYTNSSLPH